MRDESQRELRPDRAGAAGTGADAGSDLAELQVRNLVRSSPMGMHFYRLEPDGRLVFEAANPAADSLLGIDNAQFVGKTIEEAFPTMAGTELPERYRRVAATGETWHTKRIDYEDDQIRGAFDVCAFQTSPGRMVATFLEVTDHVRAEQARKMSEERLRSLFESMAQGVIYQDTDGRIVAANPAAERILGLSLDQLQGLSSLDPRWRAITEDGEDFPGVDHPAMRALASGRPAEAVMGVFNTRTDSYRWITVASVPQFRPGESRPHQVFSTFTDITERMRAQEQRTRLEHQLQQAQKLEAVGRLAGGVAHDFNNLLTAIQGHADLARINLEGGAPVAENLERIVEVCERASALTQQLLAISRKQTIVPKVIDLNDVVTRSRKMLDRVLGEAVEVREVLAADLWPVQADRSQIDQVLLNLAVNARDAMAAGGRLTFRTENVVFDADDCCEHPDAVPGSYVALTVSDDGCGMDDETRARAFEPFFSTKGEGAGTGLGLAMVYGIVQQNSGAIELQSAPGRGTSVRILLPREDGVAESPPPPLPFDLPRGNETILLVEDEAPVRDLARRMLEKLGYRVLIAEHAEQAIAQHAARIGEIQLLLTDVVMPGLNGKQLYLRLRRLRRDLKVLYTSGYAEDVIAHHGVIPAGTPFLAKPFSLRGLAARVRATLDAAQSAEAAG